MNPAPIYPFQRGEPVVIGQRVLSAAGDPALFVPVAVIKRTAGQVIPKADAAIIGTFAAEFVPAAGAAAAYWLLSYPAGLPTGMYCTDVRFMKDGQVAAITGPAFLKIVESVSG